jgi:hypothetical protein
MQLNDNEIPNYRDPEHWRQLAERTRALAVGEPPEIKDKLLKIANEYEDPDSTLPGAGSEASRRLVGEANQPLRAARHWAGVMSRSAFLSWPLHSARPLP